MKDQESHNIPLVQIVFQCLNTYLFMAVSVSCGTWILHCGAGASLYLWHVGSAVCGTWT